MGRVLSACVNEYHREGEGADWRDLSRLSYTCRLKRPERKPQDHESSHYIPTPRTSPPHHNGTTHTRKRPPEDDPLIASKKQKTVGTPENGV